MFAQILGGEVRKWFKGLTPHSINDLQAFHQTFLNKWEVKKNPLQIFSDYKNLHRDMGESVQAYCTKFNSVYNALSPDLKPPQGSALAKFPEGFDPKMAYQLRERDPLTLEDMQKGALAVEVNLIEKRARMRNEKKVSFREETAPSTCSSKMERMMEEMMKKVSILERAQSRENQSAPQNRNQSQNQNQNFRRNQPQNR